MHAREVFDPAEFEQSVKRLHELMARFVVVDDQVR